MESFDVVIVGSGAGGSPIAYELARAGKTVCVLEKGPGFRTQDDNGPFGLSDFKRDELFGYGCEKIITIPGVANQGSPYFPSHVEPDLNDEPHIYAPHNEQNPIATIEGYTAQVVGGGTQLYGGVSLRFTEEDFRLQSFNLGRKLQGNPNGDAMDGVRDWPISYAELEPYYVKTEQLIGLNGTVAGQGKPFSADHYQTPLPPNAISEFARDGMVKLGMTPYRTPLAVITQDHAPSGRKAGSPKTAYVNRYGDPLGLKSNTWVTLLRPTLKAYPDKLTLRPNCVVTHLSAAGSRISQVNYRDASGEARTVTGKIIIIACSAIETVRLLMISAEEDMVGLGARLKYDTAHGLLGRYFLTHCFGGAEAACDAQKYRFDKSLSLDSDYATDACSRPDFIMTNGLWAGGVIYNNTSDQALPLSMARTHQSQDLDRLWQGFMNANDLVGDKFDAWFEKDFGTRLSVSFMANQIPWDKNLVKLHTSRDKWNRKNAFIVKQFHPHDGYLMDVMSNQCASILKKGMPAIVGEPSKGGVFDDGRRIANHILGGCRFGTDPNDSVLDRNCCVWNLDNLYVTDGSFMPTSGGANPTHTIQANAFRVAEVLKGLV